MKIPELGIGLTYHPVLDRVLEKYTGLIQVLEIEPQTHWIQPDPSTNQYAIDQVTLKKIQNLPYHKLMHSIGFPVGGSRLPDPVEYPLHHTMIEALGVPWMSEHLSFNKATYEGRDFVTNYMLPPLQTPAGVEAAVQTINSMQRQVPIPIAVETGVNYLRTIPGHIHDGLFMRHVVEQADCGILLDLHNLLTNQLNGRQSMQDFLAEIPLERVVEIHVAGGKMRGNFYIDAHSGKIPDNLLDVAAALVPQLPNLGAMIFEIFPDYLSDLNNGLLQHDLEQLNRIWERRKRRKRAVAGITIQSDRATSAFSAVGDNAQATAQKEGGHAMQSSASQHSIDICTVTPAEWEDVLAALVVDQPIHCPWESVKNDPAIELIKELIQTFRASMVSESYRYTARLLMIYLGVEEYEKLLVDFWKTAPPEPFASTEGANFIRYIQDMSIDVIGLQEVINFEKAYTMTLLDGQDRIVNFPFDPLSFMKALAEGRKPHQIFEGNYELAVEGGEGILENKFHHQAVVH
ncbi:DUF692 domain-containing protein [Paraflavitalea pollutisoli]|uniref:DUF692 domain-containing protein n=1 Tax=Paraflavitalea pollutisoli TaxID=3034143 RepID=UPI0023ED18B7|nr:DUF692 family multinuclear iron-containing protein [Paraflavitalea sp. H1-2-19X]